VAPLARLVARVSGAELVILLGGLAVAMLVVISATQTR
jgi:hypothetical protein